LNITPCLFLSNQFINRLAAKNILANKTLIIFDSVSTSICFFNYSHVKNLIKLPLLDLVIYFLPKLSLSTVTKLVKE
jgi:hypothetical protein